MDGDAGLGCFINYNSELWCFWLAIFMFFYLFWGVKKLFGMEIAIDPIKLNINSKEQLP